MTSHRFPYVLWPTILAAMSLCVLFSALIVANLFVADWNGSYLALPCPLAVLGGYYARWRVEHDPRRTGWGRLRFRIIELLAMFVLLQILVDFTTRSAVFSAGRLRVDGATAGSYMGVLALWMTGWGIAGDPFRVVEGPVGEGGASALGRLAHRFFLGGGLLFLLAGLTQPDIDRTLDIPTSGQEGSVVNLPIYFTLGIFFLSSVRYAAMRRRWNTQGSTVAADLGGSWWRYCAVSVGLAWLVSFLLPTGHTTGVAGAGKAISEPAGRILAQIATALHKLLERLGGGAASPHTPLSIPPHHGRVRLPTHPIHLSGPIHHGGTHARFGAWLGLLQSIAFWLVVVAVVVYMVWVSLQGRRRRGEVLRQLRAHALLNAVRAFWQIIKGWLDARLGGTIDRLVFSLPGRSAVTTAVRNPFQFNRRWGTSPRERIAGYYLGVVRQAARQGLGRRRAQTPHEFERDLGPQLEGANDELHVLTHAFLEARYSSHDLSTQLVEESRTAALRLRGALRALRRR